MRIRKDKNVEAICVQCGKTFLTYQWAINKGQGSHCSRKCSAKTAAENKHKTHDQTGGNNPNWKNGRSSDPYNSYVKEYKQNNSEKIKAQNLVLTEVRAGRMKMLPCKVCGALPAEAHHKDYSKPYDVTWLCRHHHIDAHKNG